jgi:hypothetical protein
MHFCIPVSVKIPKNHPENFNLINKFWWRYLYMSVKYLSSVNQEEVTETKERTVSYNTKSSVTMVHVTMSCSRNGWLFSHTTNGVNESHHRPKP